MNRYQIDYLNRRGQVISTAWTHADNIEAAFRAACAPLKNRDQANLRLTLCEEGEED